MNRSSYLHIETMVAVAGVSSAKVNEGSSGGWNNAPNTQYHIQTDEGPERYFKYQTVSGQYRKEKRLQDGSVVGSYGWVDQNGFLRLRDYVADNTGYRVIRTKMLFVGKQVPIGDAIATSKDVSRQGASGVTSTAAPPVSTTRNPLSASPHYESAIPSYPYLQPQISYDSTAVPPYSNEIINPYASANAATHNQYSLVPIDRRNYEISNQVAYDQRPTYDGISSTHNGFQYYLPRQYHEEAGSGSSTRVGSFGYIDPFGIRRVIYYNTSPGSGFVHRKNNRYVGFKATPYDPRY
ncbi:hypothetical protein C0J52_18128 [Blattella germanica]|nr:hypothetical protein C0J52_18128 [Blattella germanica]